MACLGLVTFLPERPLLRVPLCISCISVWTCLPAAGLYLRVDDFFVDFFAAFFVLVFLLADLLVDFFVDDFFADDLLPVDFFFVAIGYNLPSSWSINCAIALHGVRGRLFAFLRMRLER